MVTKSNRTINELIKLRQELFSKLVIVPEDWKDVVIGGSIRLKILRTITVDSFYLPVTAEETYRIARAWGAYPLTRAVADYLQNKSRFVPYRWQPELEDFEQYTDYLTFYGYDGIKTFGAHKLWVLSHRRGVGNSSAVNYGFYESRSRKEIAQRFPTGGGANLNQDFKLTQSLGGRHGSNHWDYSQLLQLMYAPAPIQYSGKSYSLRSALLEGVPLLVDEDKLTQEDLPY